MEYHNTESGVDEEKKEERLVYDAVVIKCLVPCRQRHHCWMNKGSGVYGKDSPWHF
jgi:hypothetical protein